MKNWTCLLVFVFGIAITPTYGGENRRNANEELAKNIAKLNANTAALKERINLQRQEQVAQQLAAKKNAAKKQAVEPAPPPKSERFVNILLVDEFGRVPDCYKGVRVSDISQDGKSTHFLDNGKPVYLDGKVVFSHKYTTDDPPVTGTICYTTEKGLASKVINVPPRNVYEDEVGTIWYDNLKGGYPRAPKGAGYTTAQTVLPVQQQ